MKKFLIIKFGGIGDIIYALPMAEALKKNENCHITWVTGKSVLSLLKGNLNIDRLVEVDDAKLFSANKLAQMSELYKTLKKIGKTYDHIFIGHRDKKYLLLTTFLKGTISILSRNLHEKYFKKNVTPVIVDPLKIHESLAFKKMITQFLNKNEIEWKWNLNYILDTIDNTPSDYICIHIGGGQNENVEFTLKNWPYFKELIFDILNKSKENIVLVGGQSDVSLSFKIMGDIEKLNKLFLVRVTNLCGKISLRQSVNIIKRAKKFIGVDSGPLHIADALGVPCVGIYGPTSTVSWGLLNSSSKVISQKTHCSPCYKDDGKFLPCSYNHECMKDLKSEKVFLEIN